MNCRNTVYRAQSGIVEFLILVFLMIFLAQQSLVLAGKAKQNGLLLLEKAVVDRSRERIDFVLTELNTTGAGKRTIILQEKPFITYGIRSNSTFITLFADAESAKYNSTIATDIKSNCFLDNKKSVRIVVEKWGNDIEVTCSENPV